MTHATEPQHHSSSSSSRSPCTLHRPWPRAVLHPSPGRFIVAAPDGPGTLSKSLSIIELSDERRQMLRMTRARRYCKRAFTPRPRRRRRQQAVNGCADAVRVIFFARAICDDDLMKYESKRSSLHVDAAADFFILRLLQPNTPTATALMNGCWTSSGKILGL